MTSGKLVLIENKNIHFSCEFKGDMSVEFLGKEIIYTLEKITKFKQFQKYIQYFNDHHFGNILTFLETAEIRNNEFNLKNYLSDYLYIKNISNIEVDLKYRNKLVRTIKPNEIIVLKNKLYIDYKDELKDYFEIFEN